MISRRTGHGPTETAASTGALSSCTPLSSYVRATSPEHLTDVLLRDAAEEYDAWCPGASLVTFEHGPAVYLFDLGSTERAERTILAVARPEHPESPRRTSLQQGFPTRSSWQGRPLDRGHLIPHSSGGLFGPNLFDQDRALNRGWSHDGKRYRALEEKARSSRTSTLIARPHYRDVTDFPVHLEMLVVDGLDVHEGWFRNRFDHPLAAGETLIDVHLAAATDSQVGSLGEETAAVLIETTLGGDIVAMGDAGMARSEGRQGLDVLAVVDGSLIAYEVKTRYRSRHAGRLTRLGNLIRPRLRPARGSRARQGSQEYVRERLHGTLDTEFDYEGIDVRIFAIDLTAMLAQQFDVNDAGTRTTPLAPPLDCSEAAESALVRILDHRGWL